MTTLPETLYHYTTPEGLIGIISSNHVWATDAFYLNDSEELIGGIRVAKAQLEKMRERATHENQRSRIDWLLNDIRNLGTPGSMAAYVCSFSSERDLLSQWRAYCKGGGFSIGFPADQLAQTVAEQGFSLSQCSYSEDDHKRLMSEAANRIVSPWIETASQPLNEDAERFRISGNLAWELMRVASRLKNASFAEEREFRVVSTPEHERRYKAEERFFRAKGAMIVPYTKIELPKTTEFWSRVHIIVGPTPHREQSKASVYALVRRYRGHAIGIDATRTPFREW